MAVPLFFAVSGFCLFYPCIRNGGFEFAAREFFLRRAIRIWPTHLLAVIVWFPIWGVGAAWAEWRWQLFSHLTFIHNLFPSSWGSLNPVLWSLGVEIQFYMVFPYFARAMYRRPALTTVVCLLLSVGTTQLGWEIYDPFVNPGWMQWGNVIFNSLPAHSIEFAAGMLAALCIAKYPRPSRTVVVACCACAAFGLFLAPYITPWIGHWRLAYAPSWLALIYVAVTTRAVGRVFAFRPLAAIGIISYSLYVYQFMYRRIPNWLFPELRTGSTAWYVAAIASLLFCGIAGYFISEKPFMALRARLRNRAAARVRVEAKAA